MIDDEDAQQTISFIIDLMMQLTDEQRMDVIREFCKYCGCDDPSCQCWNDE